MGRTTNVWEKKINGGESYRTTSFDEDRNLLQKRWSVGKKAILISKGRGSEEKRKEEVYLEKKKKRVGKEIVLKTGETPRQKKNKAQSTSQVKRKDPAGEHDKGEQKKNCGRKTNNRLINLGHEDEKKKSKVTQGCRFGEKSREATGRRGKTTAIKTGNLKAIRPRSEARGVQGIEHMVDNIEKSNQK